MTAIVTVWIDSPYTFLHVYYTILEPVIQDTGPSVLGGSAPGDNAGVKSLAGVIVSCNNFIQGFHAEHNRQSHSVCMQN